MSTRIRFGSILAACLMLFVGLAPAVAKEEWEKNVERAKREQDRQMQSAARTGKGMANVVRRYKQKVTTKDDALNRYLLGRSYWYGARERMELRQAKGQQPTEGDRKFVEKQIGLALNEMNTSLVRDPKFWPAVLAMTVIEMSRNDQKAAERHLVHLFRLNPDLPEGTKLNAQMRLARGDTRGVEPAMKRLLAKDPNDTEARRMLLAVYADANDWKKAEPHIDKLLSQTPRDPDLRLMKIDVLLGQERWAAAEKEILPLLREVGQHPASLMLLTRLVDVYVGMDEWPKAISTMKRLVARAPKNWRVRGMLIEGYMATRDFESALAEIDKVRAGMPKEAWKQYEPMFLWQQCVALANQKKFDQALAALERLNTVRPDVLHVLDLKQQVLAELKQHDKRLETLKRMQPLVKDPQAKAELTKFIGMLEDALANAGQPMPETPKGPIWSQDGFSDLLERCVHPDPEVRRKALFEYYEADVPFVDAVVYRRYDPGVEPDEECRIWVVRILGKYQVGVADVEVVRDAARYVGLALEDPSINVRKVAAEELGRIGTPAGILYLMPHLSLIKLDPLPTDEADRKDLEEEYNAARLSMSKLTGQPDTEIGAPTWVPLDETPRNREGWRLWLEKPEGIAARLKALEDIATITDIDPRWQLRYALQDLVRPAPDQVALETYKVLRNAVTRIGDEAIQKDPWWRTFPVIEDKDVTVKNLADIRARMRDWWASLPKSKK